MGTLSFQASHKIESNDDISLSINSIKCFLGKMDEKYSLKKKPDKPPKDLKSPDITINEITEAITTIHNTQSNEGRRSTKTIRAILQLYTSNIGLTTSRCYHSS